MKILLINANPVVSRLLALCTRNRDLQLEEVTSVNEIKDVVHDLVFVDDGAYVKEVDLYLEDVSIRKKVFISFVKEVVTGFDLTIQKPFLPSQIVKVIESIDINDTVDRDLKQHTIFPLASEEETVETELVQEHGFSLFPLDDRDEISDELAALSEETMMEEEEKDSDTPLPLEVLDQSEIEKIKSLLEMDEEDITADMNENEVEIRKTEVIKEQLISEGLEILDEEEIVEVLNNKKEEKKALKKKKTKMKKKKALHQKQMMLLESTITKAITEIKPAKMKKFFKGKEIALKLKIEDNG